MSITSNALWSLKCRKISKSFFIFEILVGRGTAFLTVIPMAVHESNRHLGQEIEIFIDFYYLPAHLSSYRASLLKNIYINTEKTNRINKHFQLCWAKCNCFHYM